MAVRITGLGIISAIGLTVAENLFSLENSRSGIAPVKYLNSKKDFLVGEVKRSNAELADHLGIKSLPISRTSLLGLAAAREAWPGDKACAVASMVNRSSAPNPVGWSSNLIQPVAAFTRKRRTGRLHRER